jgi:hypothetical protein
MKRFIARGLIVALCAFTALPAAAQSGAKDDAKKAGEAAKEAGKETGKAAEHVGKATAKTAKKAAKGVKAAVTGGVAVACNDGKTHTGKTNAEACAEHGGVKP